MQGVCNVPTAYSKLLMPPTVFQRQANVMLQVVDRVRSKAATYGQDFSAPQESQEQQHQNGVCNGTSGQRRLKVAPETIAMLYDKWVMPMTKQVQVRLAHKNDGRHGGDSYGFCQTLGMCLTRLCIQNVFTHLKHSVCDDHRCSICLEGWMGDGLSASLTSIRLSTPYQTTTDVMSVISVRLWFDADTAVVAVAALARVLGWGWTSSGIAETLAFMLNN
jgi:hypothetical protein